MRFISVCSGIEAASVAWNPLGWQAAAVSEIDPFPCHVLAHRHGATAPMFMPDPSAPDLTNKDARARAAAIKAMATVPAGGALLNFGDMTRFKEWPDVPDVSLLVGGTPCQSFSVAGLRQGMDDPRGNLALTYLAIAARYRPRWLVWENVPGVLSSNEGRDFGSILGGMAELGYGFAYRVLDAQYVRTCRLPFAVPQRRRRVFVVGYLGDWRPAAAALFDSQSLRGDPPPRREAGQRPAPTLAARTRGGGGLGTDFDLDGGLIPEIANPLPARMHKGVNTTMDEGQTMVAHALRGEGFDASEDGTGRGTPLVPVAFDSKASQPQVGEDGVTPTLRAMNHANSHANAGGQLAVAHPVAIQERAVSENPDNGPDGAGFRADGAAYTLEARTTTQAVAFAENSRAELRLCGGDGQVMSQLTTGGGKPGQGQPTIATRWAVRRLSCRECERLQGFDDDFTDVPYRGRNATPDGPRYKALGNSMATNAMGWIGERIQLVEDILSTG